MDFQYPQLLLLAVPLWAIYRRAGQVRGPVSLIRIALLLTLLTALAGPTWNSGGPGIDVVIVADRSKSLPSEAQARIRELISNLERGLSTSAPTGSRLALVTFGAEARVEYELTDRASSSEYTRDVAPDGSYLNDALLTALDRVRPDRPARILVLSDGETQGVAPTFAARRALERGVPIDCRLFEQLQAGDAAIDSVLLPATVSPREPFQFSVDVSSDRESTGTVEVLRDGQAIARRTSPLQPGLNRFTFRDLLEEGGSHAYRVRLLVDGDRIRENNQGAGLVHVDAGPRVLLLNSDGQPGSLGKTLEAARIPFDVSPGRSHPLSQDSLDRYRTVVLENIAADDLGRRRMERLAQFVEDLGGGLMMTGGKRSFGTGGYFRSPLEEVLPVSMELREEHRKSRVAIAVALDRSGSMAASVRGGRTKMDLANLGTAECIRLLSRRDLIAVIAVDSAPHVVQPLINVDNPQTINRDVLRITSKGGGIFVYEALVAAGRELMKADGFSTRHIILFSDAADSEKPGAYENLLQQYAEAGITVSVIGLGTETDADAELLRDIARRGRGNIMFTQDPQELPRLFTQDTMSIARNTFLEADPESQPAGISGTLLPDARLMGSFPSRSFPRVRGYNLSYLKPDATAAVVSNDEYRAPWSAFWYRGTGRAAAISLEIDGEYTGEFGQWPGYEDFLVTHIRWLMGADPPETAFVSVRQDGLDAVIDVELDPERRSDRTRRPEVMVVPPGAERANVITPDLVWTGPDSLQARVRLDRPGTWRTLLRTEPQTVTRGPSVTLPYSPEFLPRFGRPSGSETLARVAAISGGQMRTDVLSVFDNPPRTARRTSLLIPLLLLALLLLILEIASRRLSLWTRMTAGNRDGATVAAPPSPARRRRWPLPWMRRKNQQRAEPPPESSLRTDTAVESTPDDRGDRSGQSPPSTGSTPASSERAMGSLLQEARDRARRKLK